MSPRLNQVLQLLGRGLTDKEIARDLGIGVGTVHTNFGQLTRCLGVSRLEDVRRLAKDWVTGERAIYARSTGFAKVATSPLGKSSGHGAVAFHGGNPDEVKLQLGVIGLTQGMLAANSAHMLRIVTRIGLALFGIWRACGSFSITGATCKPFERPSTIKAYRTALGPILSSQWLPLGMS